MLLRYPKPLLLIFLGLAIILTGCSTQSLYQAKEEPKPKDILAKVNYDREKTGVKPNSSTYILPLSDQERSIYHEFSKTKSDLLLKGLSPTEICKLYFHAVKTGDLSTQYALYIKGDEYMGPSYKQFLKDIRRKLH